MAPIARQAFVAACLVLAACGGSPSPAADSPAAVDPADAGRLAGRVRFTGTPTEAEIVRIDGDPACVSLNQSDTMADQPLVLGDDQTLGNVFVYIRDGLPRRSWPVPAEPVVIDQQKCRYLPRVTGVQVGQPLEIRNGDPLLHNVRSRSEINQPFNQGQPVQGMKYVHTFTTREVMVPVRCDVHAWMQAWVGAVEHPFFAVTDQSGTFELPAVPAGTYTLEAWHERLGTATQQVTVRAGESQDVEFTFAR